jgi:gamma-glutamylcyclotransferase (GGCT)/AIG2-like uncharacterized protein YtfP
VLKIEEATVRGRLYDLPFGFPGLVVAQESVYAIGTRDYLADARAQHRLTVSEDAPPPGGAVYGELLTFDDPEERLPALDGLEGFSPGAPGLYQRVLVPVEVPESRLLAWAYAIPSATGAHLPDGRWPR